MFYSSYIHLKEGRSFLYKIMREHVNNNLFLDQNKNGKMEA